VIDLLVIGGGTAGLVGARTAAELGASVLLVERERTGGDCLWTGCVPSKALVAAASAAAGARSAARLGVHVEGVRVDFAGVMAHVKGAMATIEPVDSAAALNGAGVAVRSGSARFTGPGTVEVDGERIAFRHALIATGSDPAVPPVPGLDGALTSDTVWDLTELPRRLVVLGGGTIGCELGQAFARLGSAVTVVEMADRLLPNEDARAAAVVTAALRADGVTVRTASRVESRRRRVGGAGGRGARRGRRAARGAGPPARHARARPGGGRRRAHRRRPRRRRRGPAHHQPARVAAGDVTGHPPFTHVAGVHGALAASNAVLGLRRKIDLRAVPKVTYTAPEVASVGAAEGRAVRVHDNADIDRAIADGATAGFTKLVLDRRGRLVGATVVGPRAGEVLAELTLAVRRRLPATTLAGTIHPYPTYGDAPWNAALAQTRARLSTPPSSARCSPSSGAARDRTPEPERCGRDPGSAFRLRSALRTGSGSP
jgi:pyruvate/2-oxoglutarate dehydrogenase complex dihydrolipoamide dehydrogenase (E3) component